MWRKILVVCTIAVAVIFLLGSRASADDGAEDATGQTVTMSGRAAIMVTRDEYQQLRLKVNSSQDAGDWLLEIALDPTRIALDHSGNQVLQFNGTFTIGTPQYPLDSGPVTGWLDAGNNGYFTLVGTKLHTSLDVVSVINRNGSVTSRVQGKWPQQLNLQSVPEQPSDHFFWYLSRVTGILAYILLFLNVCIGLGSRFIDRIIERWRSIDLHKTFGLLAMLFLGLHVFSLLGDRYLNLNLSQLFLPFAIPYRPFWTAMGVVSFYMLLAVSFSSYLRRAIGHRSWRAIHYLSFALFFLALFHSMMAGSDTTATWIKWVYVSTGMTAIFLFLSRFKKTLFARFQPV